MDIIQNEKVIIDEVISIYSVKDFSEELNNAAVSIETILKHLLNEKGNQYELLSKNSVRDLKYYSLVHRIKEAESLNEKFYRENLLQSKFAFLISKPIEEVRQQKKSIQAIFRKFDDLIGIKILTDLNEDCKKVISLLKSSEEDLLDKSISLDKADLGEQPTLMQNGLSIYKVKGVFNLNYCFELQIKSKIVSAWGDMEHSIFYKDYFISPVRETTQATMIHIGKLLFHVDDFLLSVRNANNQFKSNSEVISFLSWFDERYSVKISQKLGGIGFKIDSISETLYYVYANYEIANNELYFHQFNLISSHTLYKHYTLTRNSSYSLKFLESIIFSWLWKASDVNKHTVDEIYEYYFSLLVDSLIFNIQKQILDLKYKELKKKIMSYYDKILPYSPTEIIFLSSKAFISHFKFMQFVKSELETWGLDDYFNTLEIILFNRRMNGNCETQIQETIITYDQREKYREILSRLVTSIKVDSSNNLKDEEVFINDLIPYLK